MVAGSEEKSLKASESLRDQSRIICKWIYSGLNSKLTNDLSTKAGAQDTMSSFGREESILSGSTNRHRDKTVQYLQKNKSRLGGLRMTVNRKSTQKTMLEQTPVMPDSVPTELLKFESDFLKRRKIMKTGMANLSL